MYPVESLSSSTLHELVRLKVLLADSSCIPISDLYAAEYFHNLKLGNNIPNYIRQTALISGVVDNLDAVVLI